MTITCANGKPQPRLSRQGGKGSRLGGILVGGATDAPVRWQPDDPADPTASLTAISPEWLLLCGPGGGTADQSGDQHQLLRPYPHHF